MSETRHGTGLGISRYPVPRPQDLPEDIRTRILAVQK